MFPVQLTTTSRRQELATSIELQTRSTRLIHIHSAPQTLCILLTIIQIALTPHIGQPGSGLLITESLNICGSGVYTIIPKYFSYEGRISTVSS